MKIWIAILFVSIIFIVGYLFVVINDLECLQKEVDRLKFKIEGIGYKGEIQ